MNELFFTVETQTKLYGWMNLFALLGVINMLAPAIAAYRLTRSRVYFNIVLTLLFSTGFFLSQFSFVFVHIDLTITPFVQLARTIFFVLTLFLTSQTLRAFDDQQH